MILAAHLALATDVSVSPPSGIATWVYVVFSILGFFGVAGLAGFWRWTRTTAVRDSKLDELLDPKAGVMVRLSAQDRQLADLQRSMRPNGLDTDQLGDIAKRTEKAVEKLRDDFLYHKGESDRVHTELREEIATKQNRRAR